MKKSILALVLLISAVGMKAQKFGATPEDSLNCIKNLSLYQDYYRQKQFDDALTYWRAVYNICPKCSKGIYVKGVKLYQKKIKATEDKAAKQLIVDTLLSVYDTRIEHFGERGFVLGRKATDMLKYRPKQPGEAYKVFEESFKLQENKMEAGALVYMYKARYKMMKKGTATKDDVISLYPQLKAVATYNIKNAKSEKKANKYKKSAENLLEYFKQVASCEDLVAAFQPKFEADPENIDQLKEILALLNTKECEDSDFYITVAKKLQEKEPSPLAAWSIANWYVKKQDCANAVKYYKEAYDLAESLEETERNEFKTKTSIRAALCELSSGRYSSAKQYAKKALAIDQNNGEAYMIIGDAYMGGANSWGENECQKRAAYWAAVDKFQVAVAKDASLREKANGKIAKAKSRYPEKSECFFHGIQEGSSITVGGWIGESTKVRFN